MKKFVSSTELKSAKAGLENFQAPFSLSEVWSVHCRVNLSAQTQTEKYFLRSDLDNYCGLKSQKRKVVK